MSCRHTNFEALTGHSRNKRGWRHGALQWTTLELLDWKTCVPCRIAHGLDHVRNAKIANGVVLLQPIHKSNEMRLLNAPKVKVSTDLDQRFDDLITTVAFYCEDP